jgi:hypothetical protein
MNSPIGRFEFGAGLAVVVLAPLRRGDDVVEQHPWDEPDPVAVGDDHVARLDERTGDGERDVDRPRSA